MDKISKIASIAVCFALLWVFSACSDDMLMEGQGANGVDMNRMVEVEIPFSLGKGITSHVVTRSTRATDQQGKDSQLSGIMVFVYENNGGDPSNDKRLAYQFFESPLTSLEGSTGGWIPDANDATCGHFKFYMPVGDVYIYLIGNAQGSFIDFFPEIGESKLANRQDFLEKVTPKWNGNMFTVDGYLPLVGSVNNRTGACTIKEDESNSGKGIITYKKENDENEYFISQQTGEHPAVNQDNSFVLKRLMCKVSMEFKSGTNVTFTPISYKFCHCAEYVSPAEDSWAGYDNLNMIDTETVTFDAQTPSSFTVYLPENIREYTGDKTEWEFADRDRVRKDDNGENLYENTPSQEGHEGHYQFENAPEKSTYVEITGKFEGNNISAETKYILHLGDFSNNKFKEFSLRRDYHYQYTVTVNGVNDIVVEVKGEDGTSNPQEKNPAVEGIVFEGGARVQLDAHYEQVEMKLMKNKISEGVYIYAKTPFGNVSCKYLPSTQKLDPNHNNQPPSIEEAKKLLQWIEFKKQDNKGSLASYGGDGNRMDVFAALDDAYKNQMGNDDYYTCFVDEYYYTTNPVDNSSIALSDFINAEDRTFSLGSDIQYSADKQSAVATAVYVLQQHSIACFYDLENQTVAKYGVELTDEIGGLPYGSPAGESSDAKNGRGNTITEIRNNTGAVNWAMNGFLLDDTDSKLEAGKKRLTTDTEWACLACLTRNRDFNGDGKITDDELRWYTPARDQMLGLWIGEPALPAKAALYPYSTEGMERPSNNSQSLYPIFTSTYGDNGIDRVIWAEEGCTFGSDYAAQNGGYVRAVRNLGATPSKTSYETPAQPYYQYDKSTRTIEVFLTDNALRSFSYRELAPHHERSVINRPYKKFQVAKHPYVKTQTASCGGRLVGGSNTQEYSQLQTMSATEAKEAVTTIASQYPGDGEASISNAVWRLPNQRELALMVVAMPNYMDYEMDKEIYHYANYGCSDGLLYSGDRYEILHCRTSFSSTKWTQYGFMYNTKGKQMQMLWTTDQGTTNLGQGTTGMGGCLCVRDVQ